MNERKHTWLFLNVGQLKSVFDGLTRIETHG